MRVTKLTTLLLVLLMIVSLVLIVVSCAPQEENPGGNNNNDGSGAVPIPVVINKGEIYEEIENGMLNAGALKASQETGKRYVSSTYNLRVNTINTEITYEANYDIERNQDSEILLRVFDYNNQLPKLFVYYANNNLYYSLEDKKNKIDGFGGTSSFAMFYEIITKLDFGDILFDPSTVNTIAGMNPLSDTANITKRKVEGDKENVTIKNINLDTQKDVANSMIQSTFVPLGRKFDPLTQMLLGFKLSSLAAFKIERFTVRELSSVMETTGTGDKILTDFSMIFDDDEEGEEWGSVANDYYLSINYSTEDVSGPITLMSYENPSSNLYNTSNQGDMHLQGYLDIPSFDAHLFADFKFSVNMTNNDQNKMKIEIRDRSENQGGAYSIDEEVLMAYYKEGFLYADATGLIAKYLGNSIDLQALNLPKLKFENLDVTSLANKLVRYAVNMFTAGIDFSTLNPEPGTVNSMYAVFLSKSRSEGDKIIITLDDELISGMLGGEADSIIDSLAATLGLSPDQVALLTSIGIFDNAYIEFSYDTVTKEIRLDGYAGGEMVFALSLYSQEINSPGLNISLPDEINPEFFESYLELLDPDTINVHFDALISTQEAVSSDFSNFMGLFIGDVSGKNSEMLITSGSDNGIRFVGDFAQQGEYLYVSMEAIKGEEVLVRVNTNPTNPAEILVDNLIMGVKYKMPGQTVIEGLTKLAGGEAVLNFENIVLNIPELAKESNYRRDGDVFHLEMFPYTVGKVKIDPLKRITGVSGLIAGVDFNITFDLPVITENPDDYLIPSISVTPEVTYTGMYDAVWQETAIVSFGSDVFEFELTFEGQSAELVTGQYEYHPTTYLFGKLITYAMYFSDQANGTRIVRDLRNAYMIIDPADITPMPELMQVIYQDGTIGSLRYRIEGFPYNNTNIKQVYSGIPADEYEVIIGEGSIAETTFNMIVEVLNSVVVVPEDDYYNDIPIVAKVTIDPYDYSIKKMDAAALGKTYNPIVYREAGGELAPTTLELTFESNIRGQQNTFRKEYLEDFDWGFDLSMISFSGGLYTVVAQYNNLRIALEVTVLAKIVSHIQINDENEGYYTVDALKQNTYAIPATTVFEAGASEMLPANEIRIYFESGKYRIVGTRPEGYTSNDDKFDGFYPGGLDWNHKVANQVTVDRAIYPLDSGKTNITQAYFGDDYAGKQLIRLTVTCPTRVVGTLPDTIQVISEITYDSLGKILPDATRREPVRISYAAFDYNSELGSFFEFDPYSEELFNTRLPSKVWIDATYRGRLQRLGYDVTWFTNLDGTPDNIIDSEGNILNALAEEEYFVVYGRIGTENNYQILTMIIHNKSGEYESVLMLDEQGEPFPVEEETWEDNTKHYYIRHLNPYDNLVLPTSFVLKFSELSGIPDTEYTALWLTEEEENALTHSYPFQGGSYIVTTKLSADSGSGMLDQTIVLNLQFDEKIVVPDIIYGVSTGMTPGHIILDEQEDEGGTHSVPYVPVDSYSPESTLLYESLINPNLSVGVQFQDGSELSSGITVEWDNLEELLSILKSPLGSRDIYNDADYVGDFVILTGRIQPGTNREQTVAMAFRVDSKVIRDLNYINLDRNYTVKDENDVIPVHILQTLKIIETDPETGTYSYVGENTINITLNKPYMLVGTFIDGNGDTKTGVCTPSQYIDYLFKRVSIGFEEDIPAEYSMVYELREDFDEIMFFQREPWYYAGDDTVAISDTMASVTFTVTKLGPGSCEQSFTVTVTAVRDSLIFSEFTERIETFDEFGVPVYGGIDGYTLPSTFSVEYYNSGIVEYDGLVWKSLDYVMGPNGEINPGDIINYVPYDFFRFRDGRIITLTSNLQDGKEIIRRLSFNKKDVKEVNYNTSGTGIYDIKDGTLNISNVYQVYPVLGLDGRLSIDIIPKKTETFFSDINMSFTLDDGWIPTEDFALDSDPTQFDPFKLAQNISYLGLAKTLFATGTITGYSGETQPIKLYIQVSSLDSGGRVYNESIGLNGTLASIDPYTRPTEENGALVIPKAMNVRFGEIGPNQAVYTFNENSDISFQIQNVLTEEYIPATEITYNKFGHTMGDSFGGPNARIRVKIILPDGNDSCWFEIEFLNRELESVFYANKSTGAESQAMIEGRYYIDPYDTDTFALPISAEFKYTMYPERGTLPIILTPGEEGYPFVLSSGKYILDSSIPMYMGGRYFFYGFLPGIGEGDSPQYFILTVIVLDRTIDTEPEEITANDRKYKFSGIGGHPNPFEGLVRDIPSSLVGATFHTLDDEDMGLASGIEEIRLMISDMPGNSNVTTAYYDFASHSEESIYADYLAISSPVTPDIKWFTEGRVLVDDDITVTGGFTRDLNGSVGYGTGIRTVGQEIALQITADIWTFEEILGISDYVVEFNKYSNSSIADSFEVSFLAGPLGEQSVFLPALVFYPIDKLDQESKYRRVIDWNGVDPGLTIASAITFRNMYKNLPENRITTESIYNLNHMQIPVDEISFGFGPNDGYNINGSVYLIIDPLNPVIPTTALARGENPNQEIQPPEIVNIGEVDILWSDTDSTSSTSIYNINIGGGKRTVSARIIDATGAETPFTVQVYYLNRTVRRVYTSVAGYSRQGEAGNYLLMERGANNGTQIPSTRSFYFEVDPVNPNLYTSNPAIATNLKYLNERARLDQSLYKLPDTLRLEFYGQDVNPSMTTAIYNEAIGRLGNVLNYSEVGWVISKDVELVPATAQNPITAKIRGYKVTYTDTIQGNQVVSDRWNFITTDPNDSAELIENPRWLGTQLNLNLTTVDRTVQYTSVSEGVTVQIGETIINYQEANDSWYIDPYDIKLPGVLDVFFKDQAMPVRYGESSPIDWNYDASYLSKTEIISGSIVTEQPNGERFMTLMADFNAYGTKVAIQFKIKARDIDTRVVLGGGVVTTEPLKGGTIYVLKGIPIVDQLPSRLYYRFEYPDGSSEIAGAPLTFDANALAGISTDVSVTDSGFGGTYTNVPATLGTIDDNNIIFNIMVIDPKLFAIKTVDTVINIGGTQTTISEYQKGNFITDTIAIGVSRNNSYAPGPETTLLPRRIVVTSDGEYIEIDNITYDIPRMKAIVNCSYTFLSFSDNARLFGNDAPSESDAKRLTVTFEVPITKYQYTGIEISEAVFQQSSYTVPLGTVIKASELPTTVEGIRPLWVLDDVNTNMAGRYDAKCYFKNAYGAIVEGKLTIIVQKKQITQEEVTINRAFLDRIYTGSPLDIEDYITFGNFLRADGKLGELQGYTILYSIDNGATWITTQPTNVPMPGAPAYMVKVVISDTDDYNITGEVMFRLVISKAQVLRDNIFFHLGDEIPLGQEVTFEYNGQERIPTIAGIPEGVVYQLVFANYVFGEPPQYSGSIRPINAGDYYMTVRFSEDQRNYDIEEGVTYSIIVKITKINVTYSLEHILDYSGRSFNVPINGLPDPIPGDIIVTYTYYDVLGGYTLAAGSRLRNAGTYRVDVAINGGANYPSYNIPGSPASQALQGQIIEVRPKSITIKVGSLSTDYLEQLLPLNSAVTIVDSDNLELPGLQGTDEIGIFGNILVAWTGGTLTRRHMVGNYELAISNLGSIHHGNYVISGAINGLYSITAALPNTRVIDNKAQLDNVLALIKDGDTVRLYLRAGNYGNISLDKNAAVSIVGSYNLSEEIDEIAVVFDSIRVTKGALLLDIVKMYAKSDSSLVRVGKDVASLTVNRSSFIDLPFLGGSQQTTVNSRAISTDWGFKGTVYMDQTSILGFAAGLYIEYGSVEISNSRFKYVVNAVHVLSGNVNVSDSTFENCRKVAIRIDSSKASVSIFDNLFASNYVAIRSAVPMRNDIKVQNVFRENGTDISLP
ncbi:MAG: hypothetical protein BWX72_01245 [Firmicutes bacterium ADurb.Bin080]|nr:MAG: hypothetical protein BWX72_01245 [Firmicutes bacterium ADurb.Bin080]